MSNKSMTSKEGWYNIAGFTFNVSDIESVGGVCDGYFVIGLKSGHLASIRKGGFPGRDIELVRQKVLNLLPSSVNLLDGLKSTTDFLVLRSKDHGEMIYIDHDQHKSSESFEMEYILKEAAKYGLSEVRYMNVLPHHEVNWPNKLRFWLNILNDEYKIKK